jgi:DNA-directed RNA polymerase
MSCGNENEIEEPKTGFDAARFLENWEFEERMLSGVAAAFQKQFLEKAIDDIRKTHSPNLGQTYRTINRAIKTHAATLTSAIKQNLSENVGRPNILKKCIASLDAELVACLTMKTILNSLFQRTTYYQAARRLALSLEEEIVVRKLKKIDPDTYDAITALSKASKRSLHREAEGTKALRYMKRLVSLSRPLQEIWDNETKLKLGFHLLLIAENTFGIFERRSERIERSPAEEHHYRHKRNFIVLKERSVLKVLTKTMPFDVMKPPLMPIIYPPKDWSNTSQGGYYHCRPSFTFLKQRRKGPLNEKFLVRLHAIEMPKVYAAVNLLQKTPWRICSRVLDTIESILNADNPARYKLLTKSWYEEEYVGNLEVPSTFTETDIDAAADDIADPIAPAVGSGRGPLELILKQAKDLSAHAPFYFPYQLDFRGRAYPAGTLLQPQGDDIARALLTFAHAKPLGKQGGRWLAIHGANLFRPWEDVSGNSAAAFTLDQRVQWVEDNSEIILNVAKNPLGIDWWVRAKSPYQFLAFCFEWAGYKREGHKYLSSLPVAMDGTCNGIQHLAAMAGDEELARKANILPHEAPSDIYTIVAKTARELVQSDRTINSKVRDLCLELINRTFCKALVMPIPYGITDWEMKNQIRKHLWRYPDFEGYSPHRFGKRKHMASCIFRIMEAAIQKHLAPARVVMDWLQAIVDPLIKQGKPIEWTTPIGFPVFQAYPQENIRRRNSHLSGSFRTGKQRIDYSVQKPTEGLRAADQKRGIVPNFVHSFDAAHMMATVNAAGVANITSLRMIHDSFACHAADAAHLAVILRREFASLYQDRDNLKEFRASILNRLAQEDLSTPYLPPFERGTLDISNVLNSNYFFS